VVVSYRCLRFRSAYRCCGNGNVQLPFWGARHQQSLVDLLISPASADSGTQANPALAALLIQIVFVAIVWAFFIALGMLMFMKVDEENRRALETADNIVKMFGGFLIGVGSCFFGIK
jgi:hypothetical protein